VSELAGIRRGSLCDEVIARLREQIASGAWPVGERIPPESELIGRLQVGRGTVREAIKALAHSGLLEVRQGDGTYVKSRSELAGALRRQMRRCRRCAGRSRSRAPGSPRSAAPTRTCAR